MRFIEANILDAEEKKAVFDLWNQEYPESLFYSNREEFDAYLQGLWQSRHVLVKDHLDRILGWYAEFKRDGELWFAMILDASIQGKGIGTQLLKKAKNSNPILNGWVIDQGGYLKRDGTPYNAPLDFYLKNDFKVLKEKRLELPSISAVKIRWMAS